MKKDIQYFSSEGTVDEYEEVDELCSKIPGNVGLVCKVAAATAIALGMHNITTAAREGKCLSLTFTYPFVAQLFAGGLRIVSC